MKQRLQINSGTNDLRGNGCCGVFFIVCLQSTGISYTLCGPCENADKSIRASADNIAIGKSSNTPNRDTWMNNGLCALAVYTDGGKEYQLPRVLS